MKRVIHQCQVCHITQECIINPGHGFEYLCPRCKGDMDAIDQLTKSEHLVLDSKDEQEEQGQ